MAKLRPARLLWLATKRPPTRLWQRTRPEMKPLLWITMKPIASISDSIDGLTVDNVKSTDKDAIEAVKESCACGEYRKRHSGRERRFAGNPQSVRRTAESDRRNPDSASRNKKKKAGAIDPDKATSGDRDTIKDLIDEIDKLIGSDNLTDSEKAEQQKE